MCSKRPPLPLAAIGAGAALPAFVLLGARAWGLVCAFACLHAAWTLARLVRRPRRTRQLRICLALDAFAIASPGLLVLGANLVAVIGWAHEWIFKG